MFKHIKYVGPRAVISQHGISYKEGKEDKYIYLMTALEILQDIDNNYEEKKEYSHCITPKEFDEKEFQEILEQYDKHLEQEVEDETNRYKQKIEHEIATVKNLKTITDIEKEVWCKNIELMTPYMIQRAINKIYYVHCIEIIKDIIIKKGIKEINAPFTKKYWHVLESVHGSIQNDKSPYVSTIKEETYNGKMIIRLIISR
jgi:phenylalanyl-tRNA synthetase alpha subunit